MNETISDRGRETFYTLTPDLLLHYVEQASERRATGRSFTLFSLENRVYDCELEEDDVPDDDPWAVSGKKPAAIAKFYRPGRWSHQQIQEEHDFLEALKIQDLNVVAPYRNTRGISLWSMNEGPIPYALFPKRRGRSVDEWNQAMLQRLGHTLARLHLVGEKQKFHHRIELTVDSYGATAVRFLEQAPQIPPAIKQRLLDTARQLLETVASIWAEIRPKTLRIHGDLHRGNLLTLNQELTLVDFDDAVQGPAVQDFWLLLPGRDAAAAAMLRTVLASYQVLKPFNEAELYLIEPLRALRLLNFNAWVLKRWEDPAFPQTFSHFLKDQHWFELHQDLLEIQQLIREPWWLRTED